MSARGGEVLQSFAGKFRTGAVLGKFPQVWKGVRLRQCVKQHGSKRPQVDGIGISVIALATHGNSKGLGSRKPKSPPLKGLEHRGVPPPLADAKIRNLDPPLRARFDN